MRVSECECGCMNMRVPEHVCAWTCGYDSVTGWAWATECQNDDFQKSECRYEHISVDVSASAWVACECVDT